MLQINRICLYCNKVQQLRIMANISTCTSATLKGAATLLRSGNLVAFPTETVYGLGADANNQAAIDKLYKAKGRPVSHPVIIHISSLSNLDRWAREIPEHAIKLARTFWPGPMTLILPRTDLARDFVTGGQDSVAIRIPANSLALELLREFEIQGGLGVAAPSANRFGKVSPTNANAISQELAEYLSRNDLILDGGSCSIGLESTIIDCTQSHIRILRPGAITNKMIVNEAGLEPKRIESQSSIYKVKAPGLLKSHYAPSAKVFLSQDARAGDGFIALSNIATPSGAIRLASPKNNAEYAQILYRALNLADSKQLSRVIVVPPVGDDIALAILDRLQRCEFKGL